MMASATSFIGLRVFMLIFCILRKAAGPDSRLTLSGQQQPEEVLPLLIQSGYQLISMNRQHASC